MSVKNGGVKAPIRRPSARELALEVLVGVEQEKAYSNLLLNRLLEKHKLERAEAALATELVYGTIQRLNTLDYELEGLVAKGLASMKPWVRCLLRMSLYQLRYLDRIPGHAAVHEAVNLAKRRGHAGIAGLVNGVLRSAIRAGSAPALPASADAAETIALAHSHPVWFVRRMIAQYGEQTAEAICAGNNEPPHTSVRVNRMRHTREQLLDKLRQAGLDARPSPLAPDGVIVRGAGNMAHSSWHAAGELSIQDESSMLVAERVATEPGMTVLDCCAAPGGKTAHMAEWMNNEGTVWAVDIHPHKTELIREQCRRLSLDCVQTLTMDAKLLGQRFAEASFDRILLDAPCSGLGVIRRKPDLKWTKSEEEIAGLVRLQEELLRAVAPLLKPGGRLVYSTCTIDKEENSRVVDRFLAEQPGWEPAGPHWKQQILPHEHFSDGFFIAALTRASSGL